MSRLTQRPKVEVEVTLRLNEIEMRALDALAGYNYDAFLETFYKHLGRAYLTPHEAGLRSLFDVIRSELPPILKRADAAREAFNGPRAPAPSPLPPVPCLPQPPWSTPAAA